MNNHPEHHENIERELEHVCVDENPPAPPAGGAGSAIPWLAASIVLSAVIISGTWIYLNRSAASSPELNTLSSKTDEAKLMAQVVPVDGIELPVRWNGLAAELVKNGTIDRAKLDALYTERGGMPQDIKDALDGKDGNIKVTSDNSAALLNVLWALGLAQKNVILEKGPMMDASYGGAANFASTGGWTLARGSAMSHYSMHTMLNLSPDQQAKVERVAKGIYRPCCGNSTYFPDCNHGMAMLGLMELMSAQNASEDDMYKAALAVNRFWFPDTYVNAAKYVAAQGQNWQNMSAKDLVGAEFSSGQGAQKIKQQIAPAVQQSGGSCGV